ncbi:MAG: LTA synthase family protein [Myxococcota bacterium]
MRAIERFFHPALEAFEEHRELARWLLLSAWLAFGIRLALTTQLTLLGVLDDLAFTLLFGALIASAGAVSRGLRIPLQALLGLVAIAAVLADTLHYRFFGSFVTFESILVATQVDEAGDSVANLFTPTVIAWGIVLPLVLLGRALWSERRTVARRLGPLTGGALAGGLVLAVAATAFLGSLTAPTFNNPVLLFARQALATPDDEALREELVAEGASTFGLPAPDYRLVESEEHPLLQTPITPSGGRRKNVVLILMESIRSHETRAGRGDQSVTPHLDRLADEGLSFVNNYAIGHQTVRGEAAILCSVYTHFGGAPIYVRYPSTRMACLPEILRDRGWTTHWISSFRRDYFNKEVFLTGHGVQQMHDMREVPDVRRRLGWGPSDEEMVEYAIRTLDQSQRPFFAEIMTLSNHDPFNHGYPIARPESDAADSRKYRDYLHGVHYTDEAVGHFFELARRKPWFRDTIFIVTADHGARVFPASLDRERDPVREVEIFHRSPLIFLGADVPSGEREFVASQVDIAPTVLELLDVRTDHAFMGRSLLADIPEDERFAVFSTANSFHIREGNRYCESIAVSCVEDGTPPCGSASEEPAPYACFSAGGDLLRDARVELLEETPARALQDRLERVVRLTRHAIRTDAIYPE